MATNPVTVVFTDGTELDVEIVARLVGAEWMYAQLCEDAGDTEDAEVDRDEIILQSDEVRYIRCANTVSDHSPNTRVHYGDDRDAETASQQRYDLYKAQHQLHPSDDPSAYMESEEQWPPTEFDGARPEPETPAQK